MLAIGYLKFFYHEFWKDEWQAWLVARDLSLPKMMAFLNYEGHPSLWYSYLKIWTVFHSIAKEDILLNLAHYLIVGITLLVFFTQLKLDLFHKILLALSYFLFFEYGVVNRAYMLVVMLAFLTIVVMRQQRWMLTGVLLFLLCQTEVYGNIFALGFSLFALFKFKDKIRSMWPMFSLLLTGIVAFVVTVFPRGHSDDFSRAYQADLFSLQNLGLAFQGMVGNTFGIGLFNDTSTSGISSLGLGLSLVFLLTSSTVFFKHKAVLLAWMTGVVGFVLFATMIFNGGVRQWGMLFVYFICMLELYTEEQGTHKDGRYWLVMLMMIAPVFHNIRACIKEYHLPFSNAKEAASFIVAKIPENVPIVALNKFETVGAAAYAGWKFYQLPDGTPFTYFKWLEKVYVPTQSELILFAKYKKSRGLIIVSPKAIDEKRFPLLRLWQKFDGENFKSEDFYFYVLDLTNGMS